MELTPLPPISLRDIAAPNLQSLHRTPGCHVTQVIDAIMRAYGGRSRPADFAQLDSENWQEAGFVWEDILSKALSDRALIGDGPHGVVRLRPGEVTRDGIIMSPDGMALPAEGEPWGEEYKATWKSARDFDLYDKRYLPWLLQMKAYALGLGVQQYRLYVLHINGDYKGYIPQVRGWHLTFTPAELQETWDSLLNRAKKEGWIA
jgi:hypothetical protein